VRIAKFGSHWSHAFVAEEDNELVGVLNAAKWPHCQMGAAEKLKAASAMVRIMGTALPRAFTMLSARAKHDPKKPHWHIGPVGVRPAHQGRGVGTALLGSFLDIADEQGASAFLETDVDRNVVLYQRFGFKVIARQEIVGIDTRFMWRQARAAAPS
jgi:ribosomal protein S18 acetylase RimI-like enzyme